MHRSHTCGQLRATDIGKEVMMSGWVQRIRDKGGLVWIDLRDRYGITQVILNESEQSAELCQAARSLNREFVVKVIGKVVERASKNDKIPTGDIEVVPASIEVLNAALLPPFIIEDETDGGEDIRMKYRYLDLRRGIVRQNLELRHKLAQATRRYLDGLQFIEV